MIVLGMVTVATADDENHKIIGKVMKEGLKGDESPFGKIKAGAATADDYATLYELSRTLRGTEAPVGEQEGYDAKVEALITATGALAYAGESPERISAVKEASNCKSCHSEHKPD
mgnify:FL=1|tara:strand:- start:12561 stop:12905 length:345 start_codon:yes stop_codon:yes gene_type:complete